MTNQNRTLDPKLVERGIEHFRLYFHGNVSVIRPVAVTVTGAIESNALITSRERAVKFCPVLTRPGIAVNQDYRSAGTSDHEMQACAIDRDELRRGLRIVVRNASGDVTFFEW